MILSFRERLAAATLLCALVTLAAFLFEDKGLLVISAVVSVWALIRIFKIRPMGRR